MFDWIVGIITGLGYAGVATLTFLEHLFPPIPSELILPLAGYVTKAAPARYLLGAASVLVICLSIWQGIQLWPRLLEYPVFRQMADLTVLLR